MTSDCRAGANGNEAGQALDSLGKPPLAVGLIPPTPGIVDQWYNDSTGEGDDGEIDTTGPWNTAEDITVVEAPALAEFQVLKATPIPTPKRPGK